MVFFTEIQLFLETKLAKVWAHIGYSTSQNGKKVTKEGSHIHEIGLFHEPRWQKLTRTTRKLLIKFQRISPPPKTLLIQRISNHLNFSSILEECLEFVQYPKVPESSTKASIHWPLTKKRENFTWNKSLPLNPIDLPMLTKLMNLWKWRFRRGITQN